MASRTSRYDGSVSFKVDSLGRSDFKGLMPRSIAATPGVLEYRVSGGDRLDLLGTRFYNNDRQWWRIADANEGFLFASDMTLEGSPIDPPDKLERHGMSGVVIVIPEKQ